MSIRSRIPPGLKRILVPAWNAAHRQGWLVRDHACALARGQYERCAVCGCFGPMLYRRRVIPARLAELWGLTERQARALARKESSDCARCGAKLRCRRLARVLLELYNSGGTAAPASSLARWVELPSIRALRIAEINRIDGIHETLGPLPHLHSSDYIPGAEPGSMVNGERCEDLTRLTYLDESFDLVLTSETLEHVPNLNAALAEIRRVLVPGGRHLCTVPIIPSVPQSFARMRIDPDGRMSECAPRIFHPGGDFGYPVVTELGMDFPALVRAAGFEVDVRFGPVTDDDLAQVYVCRKPL